MSEISFVCSRLSQETFLSLTQRSKMVPIPSRVYGGTMVDLFPHEVPSASVFYIETILSTPGIQV